MVAYDRRGFLSKSRAGAAIGAPAVAAASAALAEEPEISQLGKTPKTRFAVNVQMWWTRLPFLERVQKAADFGYPAIELWPYENKDIDKLAALTGELKIEIAQFTAWGFTPGRNNPENEDKFVAKIEQACLKTVSAYFFR